MVIHVRTMCLLLVLLLLLTTGLGCGGNRDPGINSGKDQPRPPAQTGTSR